MNSEYILKQVELLKKRFPGCDPGEICEALGIKVCSKDLGSLKGLYIFFEGEAFIIVNSNSDEADRRMTIAHELGHDRLHRDACDSASFADSMLFDLKGRTELEADIFAAELMIDDKSVLTADTDCYSLARSLSVHTQLMICKLYSMKLRGFSVRMPEEVKAGFMKICSVHQ